MTKAQRASADNEAVVDERRAACYEDTERSRRIRRSKRLAFKALYVKADKALSKIQASNYNLSDSEVGYWSLYGGMNVLVFTLEAPENLCAKHVAKLDNIDDSLNLTSTLHGIRAGRKVLPYAFTGSLSPSSASLI